MNHTEQPELIDWHEQRGHDSRFIGGFAGPLLGTLLLGGALGYAFCYPRSYYRVEDYYTCSPRYICKPVPYWPGQ